MGEPQFVCEDRFARDEMFAPILPQPNLVAVHDAGFDRQKGVYYLVMDYVQGSTLRDTIAFEVGFAALGALLVLAAAMMAYSYLFLFRKYRVEK